MAISDWMHSYAYVLMYKDNDGDWCEHDISFSEEHLTEMGEDHMNDPDPDWNWFGYRVIRVPIKYLTPSGAEEDEHDD